MNIIIKENDINSYQFLENDVIIGDLKIDTFNSSVFGLKMANFNVSNHRDILIPFIEKKALEHKIDHLTIKVSTDNKNIVHALQRNNYLLMDTLVTYTFNYSKSKLPEISHKCKLRNGIESDICTIVDFTKKSFVKDRFHADESLINDLCDEYYAKWVENSFNGFADNIIVAELDGEPVGFTTCNLPKTGSNVGKLVLSAVSEKSRGKGIYTSMIVEGLKWLKNSSDYCVVGTQINNFAVQKTWCNLGLYMTGNEYVFHKLLKKIK